MYDPSLLTTGEIVGESGAAGRAGSGAEAGRSGSGNGTAGLDDDAGAGGSGAESGSAAEAGKGGFGGGVSGAGGSAGGVTAGSAGTAGAPVPLAREMIDDMEDNDASIDDGTNNGRTGDWYAGHDATATGTQFPGVPFMMSPIPSTDARYATSKHAAMTNGKGFTTWGSNLGVNMKLVSASTGKHPTYDASAYCGLHFYARVGAAAGTNTKAFLRVIDKYSHPDGGECGSGGKPCYVYFQKVYTFGPEWQEVSVLFSDLMDEGWPPMLALDAIFAIEFGIPQNTTFELWVDDLSFLKKPASGTCPTKL